MAILVIFSIAGVVVAGLGSMQPWGLLGFLLLFVGAYAGVVTSGNSLLRDV